jgi:gliding motility-associated-like protein
MKPFYPISLVLLLILLDWQQGISQPSNDKPCSSQLIGALTNGNSLIDVTGTNVGATSNDWVNTLNVFPQSCKGNASWNHTVFYHFSLNSFIRGYKVVVTPLTSSGKFHVIETDMGISGCTASTGHYVSPTDSKETTWSCANHANEPVQVGEPCLYFIDGSGTTSYPNNVYFMVASDSPSEQGPFQIKVTPVIPTLCDNCKNGNEINMDNASNMHVDWDITNASSAISSDGSISITQITGGDAPYQSFAVDGSQSSSLSLPVTFSNLSPGNHTFSHKDANGCTISYSFLIELTQKPKPPIASSVSYCENASPFTLFASGTNIQWYSDATLSLLLSTGNSFTPFPHSTTTYFVTQTVNGLRSEATPVTLTIKPSPSIDLQSSDSVCVGTVLSAISNAIVSSYQWKLNNDLLHSATSATLKTSSIGNYTVEVVNNGCVSASTPFTISTCQPSPPIATNSFSGCFGDSVSPLQAVGQDIRWYDLPSLGTPIGYGNSFIPKLDSTKTFYVTQSVNGHESAPTPVTITIKPLPIVFLEPAGTGCLGSTLSTKTNEPVTYQWIFFDLTVPDSTNNTFKPHNEGEYSVLVKSIRSDCQNHSKYTHISPCKEVTSSDSSLFIYTGISPNDDAVNDYWIIDNIEKYPENEVKVYNQWGNLVFHQSGYTNNWNGKGVPDGTYFFLVKTPYEKPRRGYLTIIR